VSCELRKVAKEGAHSGVFFRELGLAEPNHYLAVGSGLHGHQTGEMLKKIEEVLLKEQPDVALVYGDTNSTLAGSVAGSEASYPCCTR
jgi:UDP-N-acetylglucosamine 2-epimerase